MRQFRIECGEGLVQEEDIGFGREGPGECHALLLAATEFVGHTVLIPGQADHLQRVGDDAFALGGTGEPEADIGGNVEMTEEGALLKDHADPAPLGRVVAARSTDLAAVEVDRAGVQVFKSGDKAEHGRFAAAAGTEQGRKRAGRDVQIDIADGGYGAEPLDQTAANQRHAGRQVRRGSGRLQEVGALAHWSVCSGKGDRSGTGAWGCWR